MSDLENLKQQLSEAVNTKALDFDKILSLATEMAKSDTDNVRFSVDASHISRLGIELVSKQETAVAELVKNAYDADATSVDLVFKNSAIKGGSLEIFDNGHGMSRDQLLNGFMRISTQDKFLFPISSKFNRQRAGRKGIGRFATQRLGRKLTITTQLDGEASSLMLDIDWDLFERGKDLHLISSQIKIGPALERAGTVLLIENLRDSWTESQIQRTYRYILELLQPFPLSAVKATVNKEDPGFKATFKRNQNGSIVTVAGENESIYANAIAKFAGGVSKEGVSTISIVSERYDINVINQELSFDQKIKSRNDLALKAYSLLKGVSFNAHYFIQDELPSGTRSSVQKVLQRQGGIRVYRNGFRVLPYGEAFDDWLGLQRSSALRELLPPHHNSNFLGFVEITDVAGDKFEETASREGLLENEAFLQLQDFLYRSLIAGVIELAKARNKKVFASDDKPVKSFTSAREPDRSPKDIADHVADQLRAAAAAAEAAKTRLPNQGSLLPNIEPHGLTELATEVEKLGAKSQELLEENGMLRVLASLGLTIGEFTHEVRHALAALKASVDKIEADGMSKESIASTKDNMFLLQSYARYFDNAITQNAHRTLSTHELRDLVTEFSEVVRPTLVRQNVELQVEYEGYDLFTKPMHKSEWSSIFLNLFTNSLKAIQRAHSKGAILIAGGRSGTNLYLEFSDNGDGVPEQHAERIFDAFFTTSLPPGALAFDSEKLVGTGLGLKIVKDIVESAGGEIYLTPPKEGYSTCFRIEIPQASEEEIGDERY